MNVADPGGADNEPVRPEDSKAAGGSATVDAQLRVGAGFSEDERPEIVRLQGTANWTAPLQRLFALTALRDLSSRYGAVAADGRPRPP